MKIYLIVFFRLQKFQALNVFQMKFKRLLSYIYTFYPKIRFSREINNLR